jgi:hypothetical protein
MRRAFSNAKEHHHLHLPILVKRTNPTDVKENGEEREGTLYVRSRARVT